MLSNGGGPFVDTTLPAVLTGAAFGAAVAEYVWGGPDAPSSTPAPTPVTPATAAAVVGADAARRSVSPTAACAACPLFTAGAASPGASVASACTGGCGCTCASLLSGPRRDSESSDASARKARDASASVCDAGGRFGACSPEASASLALRLASAACNAFCGSFGGCSNAMVASGCASKDKSWEQALSYAC